MFTSPVLIFLSLLAVVTIAGYLNSVLRGVPTDQVCFDGLDCFEMGEPWTAPLRPLTLPQSPYLIPTTVYLFTRHNRRRPQKLNTFPDVRLGDTPFDGQRATLLVVHGYMRNSTSPWMLDLKDVYLDVKDANVFLTDWSTGAAINYRQTVSNTRVVGRVLSKFVRFLMDEYGLQPGRVHLVGHSLGAQICSYIAKDIPGIGRLTALDPAKPGFEGYSAKVRLDRSDAEFVEVIHTDPRPYLGFGMVAPHGHVDFYFNSGSYQPGCIVPEQFAGLSTLHDLVIFPIEYPYESMSCSHERAHEYLVEAYNSSRNCVFWGHVLTPADVARYIINNLLRGLPSDLEHHRETCTMKECIPFGLDAIRSPLRGVVVVKTNFESPFCLPEDSAESSKQ